MELFRLTRIPFKLARAFWETTELLRLTRLCYLVCQSAFTAPINYMRSLKFKAQPTNAFFVAVNRMLGGSSQFPATAERAEIKSNQIVDCSLDNIVGSWEEPPNIWLTVVKNAFVGKMSFEFESLHVIERCSKLREMLVFSCLLSPTHHPPYGRPQEEVRTINYKLALWLGLRFDLEKWMNLVLYDQMPLTSALTQCSETCTAKDELVEL